LDGATDVVLVIELTKRVIVTAMHGYKVHTRFSHRDHEVQHGTMRIVEDTLGQLEIGPQVAVANLTVVPLTRASRNRSPCYLTLDEALSRGLGEVTEISEFGSALALRFLNAGHRSILLVDGEVLIGAKQNRILNLSILAPAGRSIYIPVSCVEAGRWSRQSKTFRTVSHAQYASGRARKSAQVSHALRERGTRSSDQTQLWSDIDAKMMRLKVHSRTTEMGAMYESYAGRLDDFVNGTSAVDGQVGALFAIDGTIVGLDLFDHAETLKKLLPKIVRGYALDAIDVGIPKTVSPRIGEVRSFLNDCAAALAERFEADGEGEDLRLTGTNVTGAALVVDGRIVHLCAFTT
jgi:hypothetical protein